MARLFCLILALAATCVLISCSREPQTTQDLQRLIEELRTYEKNLLPFPIVAVKEDGSTVHPENDIFQTPHIKVISRVDLILKSPFKENFLKFFEEGFLNNSYKGVNKIFFLGYQDQLIKSYSAIPSEQFAAYKKKFSETLRVKLFIYPELINGIDNMLSYEKGIEILHDTSILALLTQFYSWVPNNYYKQATAVIMINLGYFEGLILYFKNLLQDAKESKDVLGYSFLLRNIEERVEVEEFVTLITNLKKCKVKEESINLLQHITTLLEMIESKMTTHFRGMTAIYTVVPAPGSGGGKDKK